MIENILVNNVPEQQFLCMMNDTFFQEWMMFCQ